MSVDRRINPATGDFESGPAGSFVTVDPVENQIVFSVLTPLGSWEGNPKIGSRMHELRRARDEDATYRRIEDFSRECVRWLVDRGLLERVDARAWRFERGKAAYLVEYFQPGGKEKQKVGPFFVELGS